MNMLPPWTVSSCKRKKKQHHSEVEVRKMTKEEYEAVGEPYIRTYTIVFLDKQFDDDLYDEFGYREYDKWKEERIKQLKFVYISVDCTKDDYRAIARLEANKLAKHLKTQLKYCVLYREIRDMDIIVDADSNQVTKKYR